MTAPAWEDVVVPRGAYISWGNQVGQHVTGKVMGYDPVGGTDFDGNRCPQLQVELIEAAASIDKNNVRTDFPAGEFVVLNCGQVSLKRAIQAADPATGDLVKIVLSNLVNTPKGQVKEFSIKIARGAGGKPAQASAPFQQAAPAQAPAANPFAQPAPAAPAAQAAPPF